MSFLFSLIFFEVPPFKQSAPYVLFILFYIAVFVQNYPTVIMFDLFRILFWKFDLFFFYGRYFFSSFCTNTVPFISFGNKVLKINAFEVPPFIQDFFSLCVERAQYLFPNCFFFLCAF